MREAVAVIKSRDKITSGGLVGNPFPEHLTITLEDGFLKMEQPRGLAFVYVAGQGDSADLGMNHFSHKELVRRIMGEHTGLASKLGRMAVDNSSRRLESMRNV